MKLKIILGIMLMFLITGCTPRLNYTILDGKITEEVEINFDEHYSEKEVEQKLEYYSFRNGLDVDVNVEETTTGFKGTATISSVSMNSYFENDNTLINECYKMVSFTEEDNKYYLNTSKGFQCMTYDYNISEEVIITVKTYNKVYKHNADKVEGNKYTWYINNDNDEEQSILFVVGKGKYVWYYKYRWFFMGLLAILSVSLVVGIVVLIFKNIGNKVNRI